MSISIFKLDKEKLCSLPINESKFFIMFGHIFNEINALTKLLYWSSNNFSDNLIDINGGFTYNMLLISILTGKLFEAWEYINNKFRQDKISRGLISFFDEISNQHLSKLKKFFSSKNLFCIIRNHFGFHYDSSINFDNLEQIREDELLSYFDGESTPNSLFYFSEAIIANKLLIYLASEKINTSYEKIIDDLFIVSESFMNILDAYMDAMIERYKRNLLKTCVKEEFSSYSRNFEEITLPWFSISNNKNKLRLKYFE